MSGVALRQDAARPLWAERVAGIPGSAIDSSTSLLQSQTHDIVRFAMGSPAPQAIPAQAFADAAAAVLSADQAAAFDYGPTEGERELRGELLRFLQGVHKRAPAEEELLITSGGMQGLDLTCKLFVDPGDLVAVESPTYTNGTAVITSYGGEVLEIPTDAEGMDVDRLEELGRARPPKLIYVIPNFQNPSGTTLSLARRRRLLELAGEWGSVVLEDDPYRELRFGGEWLPSLQELAPEGVTVVGVHTFSKILAPGLRVGWVSADAEIVAKMVDAKQGLDTCTNVPMQRLVAEFMRRGLLDDHLVAIREIYRSRKLDMQRALEEHFADLGAEWTDPEGGFFLWLTLPEGIDTQELFPIALREGVAYIPGPAFSASGRFANALRVAFSATSGERTELGVARLRRSVEAYLSER